MSGRINNIKTMFEVFVFFVVGRRPKTGRGGRSYGNATLALLLHPIHDGSAFVHFADFVRHAGVIQNTLGGSGFPRVNVGNNAKVTNFF